MSSKYVEIMDTTLRDGEQTPGISYTPAEKLRIARLLIEKVRVDRLEIASSRVSDGEREGAKSIISWAEKKGKSERIEILGFVDNGKSIDWINEIGGKTVNLLTKGSERHCVEQLRKKPDLHFTETCQAIEYARACGINANIYLEDWSSGMQNSLKYVHSFIERLSGCDVKRIMLADTLGILAPQELKVYLDWMKRMFPDIKFDFHAHNDYGLATANTLCAVKSGINGVHTTVNGLGERAGNSSLCEVIASINDMSTRKTKVMEKQLGDIAKVVQATSGKRLPSNAPIVGMDVYTQTCGVHADGDKKGNLYANPLTPERFNRKRSYALGKLSGKASIDKNLEELGLDINSDTKNKVLKEVIRLGDKKKKVTPDDLPFIIADVLKTTNNKKQISILNYNIITKRGVLPKAKVELRCFDQILKSEGEGDGGYDAFMKAVRKVLRKHNFKIPKLIDYDIHIPPGGNTDALVEATIRWNTDNTKPLVTIGIDSDQIVAAISATEKMLNTVIPPQVKNAEEMTLSCEEII